MYRPRLVNVHVLSEVVHQPGPLCLLIHAVVRRSLINKVVKRDCGQAALCTAALCTALATLGEGIGKVRGGSCQGRSWVAQRGQAELQLP